MKYADDADEQRSRALPLIMFSSCRPTRCQTKLVWRPPLPPTEQSAERRPFPTMGFSSGQHVM
jgi:hypothetical protein